MGTMNDKILSELTQESNLIQRNRYIINEPMAKTIFFKISPIALIDEEMPIAEEEQEKQVVRKQLDQVKVKWRSFIKMRQGNFMDQYEVRKQLGRGGFGSVYKVKGRYNGIIRAAKKIKKCDLDAKEHERLFKEVSILQALDHPNIVKLYEVYDMEDQYVLIMELCEGGQLFKRIAKKKLSLGSVPKVMRQLLQVLAYIHSKDILHRDIKPQNIMFDKETGDIKIIDFGIAETKKTPDEVLSARIGTAYYIAPQVLCKQYGEKCDIWSAGVVFYMMLFNRPPFNGGTETDIIRSILNEEPQYQGPIWSILSKDCKDLLCNMLKKKPKQRLSAFQALKNKWLAPENKEKYAKQLQHAQENMQYFGFKNRLEAVVYTYCISQLVTNEQKIGLEIIFKQIDKDFDGIISIQELREVLKEKVKDEQRLQSIMRLIDLDGSGSIQYTQFLISALNPRLMLKTEHYARAFDYFDIDHSGGISYQQIAKFLDGQESQQAIKAIFCEIDQNGDGNISREEFVTLFLKSAKASMKQIASSRQIETESPLSKTEYPRIKKNKYS